MRSVSGLAALIDDYAGVVGFRRSSPAAVVGAEEGIHWEAPYAQLVLWQVQATGKPQIRAEVEKAQEMLDGLLVSAEKRLSGVVDGYLLLYLENEPDQELHALVRSLELDTNVCRKNFIWPEEGDKLETIWQRLWRMTVIGLPESPAPAGMVKLPELKLSHKEIWQEISRNGSANAARKALMGCRRW